MIVVLDASTLINLVNGEVLATVLDLPGLDFRVSPAVRDESNSIAAAVTHAVQAGRLGLIDDALLSARAVEGARAQWHLGLGETECILAAAHLGCAVACDDWAARQHAKRHLGEAQVTGVIGLLRRAREMHALTAAAAAAAYALMKARGGYLPDVPQDSWGRPVD